VYCSDEWPATPVAPAAPVAVAARELIAAREVYEAAAEAASAWSSWEDENFLRRRMAGDVVAAAQATLELALGVEPPLDGWCALDLSESTTPAQRASMLVLASCYGHEWAAAHEGAWVEHGIAVWPAGHPGLPGGIWPSPDHMTGSGRLRWAVREDGTVAWEVWRGPRQTSTEACEGLRDETTAATAAGRVVLAEWTGREFRTNPRPAPSGPAVVLIGTTAPDGQIDIMWHSTEAEERHYDAIPYL
jgi:hypothetical protein